MANLWTLKFGKDAKLPVLVRSGTNVGSNMSFVTNRVYKDLQGPSDPIDVNNDFPWTKSPKSSRQDVPTLRMVEKRITKNSTVSNLAYSLLASADLANTIGTSIVNAVKPNDEKNVNDQLNILREGSSTDETGKEKGLIDTIAQGAGEMLTQNTFESNVLKPYNFLYSTEKTGFEYIFPYLDNAYRESSINMGSDQGNLASDVLGAARDLQQQATGLALVLRPGVYIEEAKQFSMGDEGRTLNIKIPLLNTGSYDDISRNYQLIYGLIYQNRPGRITKNLVDVPVIYETYIEGVAYMPYSYIKSMTVNFLGNRRTMDIDLPVTKFTSSGSDTGTQVRTIKTAIPDAYELNFQITGLNDETRNFMYESIDRGVVTAKVNALNNPDTDSSAPGTETTQGGPTSNNREVRNNNFSARSNPNRRRGN